MALDALNAFLPMFVILVCFIFYTTKVRVQLWFMYLTHLLVRNNYVNSLFT